MFLKVSQEFASRVRKNPFIPSSTQYSSRNDHRIPFTHHTTSTKATIHRSYTLPPINTKMRLPIPTTQILLLSSLFTITASAGPLPVTNTQPSLSPSPSTPSSLYQPSTTTSTPAATITITTETETETGITSPNLTSISIKKRSLKSSWDSLKADFWKWWDHED